LVNCACPGNECSRIDICPAKDYWFELSSTIKNQMESSTLDEIKKRHETAEKMN